MKRRQDAWGDFEEKRAERRVQRLVWKSQSRGCGPGKARGFNAGKKRQALGSPTRGRGLPRGLRWGPGRISCGER